MTYSLPFNLKQKPLNKYFDHGLIKFNVREGKLFYTIRLISKNINGLVQEGEVKTKSQLDKLLSIKTFSEIHDLEEVVN